MKIINFTKMNIINFDINHINQGPKFRIGELKDHKAVNLVPGAKLKLSVGTTPGDETHIYTKNAAVVNGLSVGMYFYLPHPFIYIICRSSCIVG